jgi:hypothetical protein
MSRVPDTLWFGQEGRALTSEVFGLTQAQWELLRAAPAHIFSLVAGADSHPDQHEWAAFAAAVAASVDHEDELVRRVMSSITDELRSLVAGQSDSEAAIEALRQVRESTSGLPGAGEPYRMTLFELGITIAESSGGQLTRAFVKGEGIGWVRASGTSAMELERLQAAAEALGLG